jgi:hypothetical protein
MQTQREKREENRKRLSPLRAQMERLKEYRSKHGLKEMRPRLKECRDKVSTNKVSSGKTSS